MRAKVCELIGIFMLSIRNKHINHIKYKNQKLKKKFQKLFKEKERNIIVQCNLKITNYLYITLNLNDDSYHPYRKPTIFTKKPATFTSILTTHHQSLKKFYNQLKKDSQFCHHHKIFFRN